MNISLSSAASASALVTLNRPKALNALNAALLSRSSIMTRSALFDRDAEIGCVVIDGLREGFRGRRRHPGDVGTEPTRPSTVDDLFAVGDRIARHRAAR